MTTLGKLIVMVEGTGFYIVGALLGATAGTNVFSNIMAARKINQAQFIPMASVRASTHVAAAVPSRSDTAHTLPSQRARAVTQRAYAARAPPHHGQRCHAFSWANLAPSSRRGGPPCVPRALFTRAAPHGSAVRLF